MDIVALKAVLRQAKKRDVTEVVRETYAMENDESKRLFSLGEQLAILMNRLASQDEERRARMFMWFLRNDVPEKDWAQVVGLALYALPTPLGKLEWLAIFLMLFTVVLALIKILWR